MRRAKPIANFAALLAVAAACVTAGDAVAQSAASSKAEEGAGDLVRGNAASAIASLTEALKDSGLANDRRATILNDRAVAYARLGQPKAALDDFNQSVQLFAEYPAAYNNRGNLLMALGNEIEAIKDFDRAILLAPKYAAAYSNRASARIRLGKYADAIADFSQAIQLMPANAAPLSGRGLAFLASGKPHAAIRDFSRAVNADARFASAYRNRAEARMTVTQRPEAIEDLSRALAFDARNSEIYVVRGYAYLADANMASAIKDFSSALEIDVSYAAAYQGRGLANALAEAYDDAFADLNRAIELDPRSPVGFAYRAYVYKQTGQPDIGTKDVETALKLDPANSEALWARGEIAEARGEADKAVEDLRKVLAMKPGWRLASDALSRLGAAVDVSEDRDVPALAFENWRVVARGTEFFAVSDDYPALRVPLEMMGEGRPQLLGVELKEPPHKGYAVLRYAGGSVAGPNGPEPTELAAILDLEMGKVMAIQPHRQGVRVASWTWDVDRVQVASIDGVTDEFSLRSGVAAVAPAAIAPGWRRAQGQSPSASGAVWAPWDKPVGSVGNQRPAKQAKRTQKPKSIFDLLFNN